MTRTFILIHDEARRRALEYVGAAPAGWQVRVSLPPKSRDQENLAHSCYEDFAATALLDGRRATTDEWKEHLKTRFFDETGADPEFADDWHPIRPTLTPVPGTRYVVMSAIHTSKFPRRLYRAYITFLHATGDDLGVRWSATSLGREPQELSA